MVAKARIIRIGNSRGIRVPKAVLDQANPPEEVELYGDLDSFLCELFAAPVKVGRMPRGQCGEARMIIS
jgi:hypothetical protein